MTTEELSIAERNECCNVLTKAISALRNRMITPNFVPRSEGANHHLRAEDYAVDKIISDQENVDSSVTAYTIKSIENRIRAIRVGRDNCKCTKCAQKISLERLERNPLTPVCSVCFSIGSSQVIKELKRIPANVRR